MLKLGRLSMKCHLKDLRDNQWLVTVESMTDVFKNIPVEPSQSEWRPLSFSCTFQDISAKLIDEHQVFLLNLGPSSLFLHVQLDKSLLVYLEATQPIMSCNLGRYPAIQSNKSGGCISIQITKHSQEELTEYQFTGCIKGIVIGYIELLEMVDYLRVESKEGASGNNYVKISFCLEDLSLIHDPADHELSLCGCFEKIKVLNTKLILLDI
jgi:hypothetical protein